MCARSVRCGFWPGLVTGGTADRLGCARPWHITRCRHGFVGRPSAIAHLKICKAKKRTQTNGKHTGNFMINSPQDNFILFICLLVPPLSARCENASCSSNGKVKNMNSELSRKDCRVGCWLALNELRAKTLIVINGRPLRPFLWHTAKEHIWMTYFCCLAQPFRQQFENVLRLCVLHLMNNLVVFFCSTPTSQYACIRCWEKLNLHVD